MTIDRIMQRKDGIIAASPTPYIPQRTVLGAVAESLSRRRIAAERAEVLNEALDKATVLLYETGYDGKYCNMHPDHGQVFIPLPWGSSARRHWNLMRSDSDTLRHILFEWQASQNRPPLYTYDPEMRRWFVNIFDYPNLQSAQFFLGRQAITGRTWSIAASKYAK